jgi:hypothetical protein
MSHDRGCHCGKEKYEYDDCQRLGCVHKRPPERTKTINENTVRAAIVKACANNCVARWMQDRLIEDTIKVLYE